MEMILRNLILLFLLASLFNINSVYSTVFTSVQNGYWPDASTWDQVGAPTTSDTVIVKHFVQAINNLTIDAYGYLLVQSSGRLCGRDLYMTVNCNGFVDNYGDIYVDSLFVHGNFYNYGYLEFYVSASISGPCPTGTSLINPKGGSVNVDSVECSLSTSIVQKENIEDKIKVYPNPFSGTTTVKLSHQLTIETSQLQIYDITGRRVKIYLLSKNQTALTLHANEIGTGMFFIQLVGTNEVLANSVIIISD